MKQNKEKLLFSKIKLAKDDYDILKYLSDAKITYVSPNYLLTKEKKLVSLINKVNDFKEIGQIKSLDDTNDNEEFINWFNKFDSKNESIL